MTLLRARYVLPILQPPLENGGVAILGNHIVAVGPWKELHRQHSGEVMDLGEAVLLPGLINAHCHLDYTDLAGKLFPPRYFPDWLKAIVAVKATLSREDFAGSWQRGAAMLLRTGTTTVADIEAVPELLPALWDTTPLRIISFREIICLKSGEPAHQAVQNAVRDLEALPNALGRIGLSPHAPYTTTAGLLEQTAALARERGWPLATHLAESAAEFEMFVTRRGPLHDWLRNQRDMADCGHGSPVQHLARQGCLNPGLLAVHVNYLAPDDAALLGRQHVNVVHCPRSHAYFKHARFPREELAGQGVNLCLGTDSLATTLFPARQPPQLDLLAEMRALTMAAPDLPPLQILAMATLNGAKALGREGQIGQLATGALADLIALPLADRRADVYETVVHHAGPVRASMIDGQWAIAPTSSA